MRFVRFADIWQREDYGYLDRDGVTSEVVFLTADRGNTVVLEFTMASEAALRTFSGLASAKIEWDPAEAIPRWRRELFYRRFVRTDTNRACMGFAGTWDHVTEDRRQRPRHGLFGYVCLPPGVPLSSADALALSRRIRVKPQAAWGTTLESRPEHAEALAFARGGVEQGNPSFPFRRARFYVVGNGRGGFN